MRKIFENVIKNGSYKLEDMLGKISTYNVQGRLSDADRMELEAMAREHASAGSEIDMLKLLLEHEARIRVLEGNGEANTPENGAVQLNPEYVVGTPTVAGDRWSWGGKNYTVVGATAANPCVWSPDGYPAYWQLDEIQPA